LIVTTAYDLVHQQEDLIEDLIKHHVVDRKVTKLPRLEERRTAIQDMMLMVFAPPIGRGGQWKRFRDQQKFLWQRQPGPRWDDPSGPEEPIVIQGIDAVVAKLGWNLSTFRTKFSKAHEVLTVPVLNQQTGKHDTITITRA
jgi:hypothetical protein